MNSSSGPVFEYTNLAAFIRGMSELEDQLKRAEPEALMKAARPTLERAKRYAPYRRGKLQASLHLRRTPFGVYASSNLPYAPVQEFAVHWRRNRGGRVSMVSYRAHPKGAPPRFLYRAFDEDRGGIGQRFNVEIVRIAKRNGWLS
jgi:hypothetical protein